MSKDDITLTQVRAVMEFLARQRGCSIADIEISHVRAELGKGNNGTIGAYIKQVKLEYVNAQEIDLSPQLRSMILEEIKAATKDIRENAAAKFNVVDGQNDELRKMNDAAELKIRELQDEAEKLRKHAEAETLKLSGESAAAKKEADACRAAMDQQRADLERYRENLDQANAEKTALAVRVGSLEAEITAIRNHASDAEAKLSDAHFRREEAEQNAKLAQQAATHQQQTIDLLSKQTERQEKELDELKSKVDNLLAANEALNEEIKAAKEERIKDLTTAQVKPPKRGQAGAGDNPGKTA